MEAVIDPVGSTIVGYIPSGACRHGGAWADFDVRVVPEGLDKETIGVERNDEGEYVFVLDPKKVQARLDAQWASVRTQQRQKLYESDWTCSVIDPPPEILAQRDQWLQYRADLRDVTTQSDPFVIVWPIPPN